MNSLARGLSQVALVLCMCADFARAQSPPEIEIILDGSGSMAGKMENSTKLAIAKQSLTNIINEIPSNAHLALRVYGHNYSVDEKEKSCKDSELFYPMGPVDKEKFVHKVGSIKARAYTPIAYSLEEAAKDFSGAKDRFIILISDGIETCGGDPCQIARNMKATGVPVVIHGIGFDVDEKAREQIVCIAEATGGKYFDARNTQGLFASLQTIAQKELKVSEPATEASTPPKPKDESPRFLDLPEKTRFGERIRGGRYYDDAVAIQPGKYRLDHDLRQNEFDYFKIGLKNGQQLRIQYTTQDEGPDCAGAAIHSKDRLDLVHRYLVGHGKSEGIALDVFDLKTSPETFYALIGSSCMGIQGRETMIDVFVEDRFDAGSGQEASSELKKPLPIKVGRYEENWLQRENDVDTFRVSGEPGKELHVKVIPVNENATLRFALYNEDRERLLYVQGKNDGAAVKGAVLMTEEYPDLFIQVSGFQATKYNLEIQSRNPKK